MLSPAAAATTSSCFESGLIDGLVPCGMADRVPGVTGIWPQRRHVSKAEQKEELKGSYAELEASKHATLEAPFGTDTGDALTSHASLGSPDVRRALFSCLTNLPALCLVHIDVPTPKCSCPYS